MGYRTLDTPLVQINALFVPHRNRRKPDNQTIEWVFDLDDPRWTEWLDDPENTRFYVDAPAWTFTAKKEKRRKGFFWYAYKKVNGRTVKRYLGKSQDLTWDYLKQVADELWNAH